MAGPGPAKDPPKRRELHAVKRQRRSEARPNRNAARLPAHGISRFEARVVVSSWTTANRPMEKGFSHVCWHAERREILYAAGDWFSDPRFGRREDGYPPAADSTDLLPALPGRDEHSPKCGGPAREPSPPPWLPAPASYPGPRATPGGWRSQGPTDESRRDALDPLDQVRPSRRLGNGHHLQRPYRGYPPPPASTVQRGGRSQDEPDRWKKFDCVQSPSRARQHGGVRGSTAP